MIAQLVKILNRNVLFKYLSSIKLAVPLLLIFAAALGWGTIVESKYNSDLAKMMVYNSWWFQLLLILLWINIFCATISRIPFKIHHTGFVITHIGLLTLLVGGVITGYLGIDGQLRVVEGQTNNIVFLQDLVLEVNSFNQKENSVYDLKRSFSERDSNYFSEINSQTKSLFKILKYIPFAQISDGYVVSDDGQPAIQFQMKSQFFNVTEWLHAQEKPSQTMGPALIRIKKQTSVIVNKNLNSKSKVSKLIVKHKSSNKVLAELDINVKKHTVSGVNIIIKKKFEEAVVGNGGLYDGGTKAKNPAIEIELSKAGETIREVCFARFPTFSLAKKDTFEMSFEYITQIFEQELPDIPAHSGVGAQSANNIIEFTLPDGNDKKIQVELIKDNISQLKKELSIGEELTTPWMGMVLKVNQFIAKAKHQKNIVSIEHPERSDLPPAALLIQPTGASADKSFWVIEGEPSGFTDENLNFELYFGRKTIELPFRITLDKFTKKDYPGTEMAMSFESDVKVNDEEKNIKISMNEPYKDTGYTLYQSSYEMNPGQTPASIFSVNHDPGRALKYIGSLILVVGIAVFTLMRSRVYKNWRKSI